MGETDTESPDESHKDSYLDSDTYKVRGKGETKTEKLNRHVLADDRNIERADVV